MIDRREFLAGVGLGAIALASLPARAGSQPNAKVKRVVEFTLVGGLSHVDSFDHKPFLIRRHGQTFDVDPPPETFFGRVGRLRAPDWKFKPRGESGLMISDLFPHIASVADDLTLIRSMTSETASHAPGLLALNTGFRTSGFPSVGNWVSYGLGNPADEWPVFVVLPDPRGLPSGGAAHWSGGFLPPTHQGTMLDAKEPYLRDLTPRRATSEKEEKDSLALLKYLDAKHESRIGAEPKLSDRFRGYELAAELGRNLPKAADLISETQDTRVMYGLDRPETEDVARQCLLARRLLQKGVKFVQIYSGGPLAANPRTSWDAHDNVKENHAAEAARIDRPVAALVSDLKRIGLLSDTLVVFTTEFGRTPFSQTGGDQVGTGRDHNRLGFSCWLTGGGLKSGRVYGATDEVGYQAVEDPVSWHDLHATILHLLGIDPNQSTFLHDGATRRLTDGKGKVIRGILK